MGLGDERLIRSEAMERTVRVLMEYSRLIREYRADKLELVATAAVREALNREEMARRVEAGAGLVMRTISGKEEARLSYLGVVQGLGQVSPETLVIDVGGGSTEFIWSTAMGQVQLESVAVGAVRATESCWGPAEITQKLAEVLNRVSGTGARQVVGVGGTATTLAAMELGLVQYDPDKVHGSEISRSRVAAWGEKLQALDSEGRKNIPGLQPQRSDIIIAGIN
ncbi:MAG TPA: Ppx/GppA family phosphatase, partial [Bacillota bacterium]|nr:Ppx/GppA family phosphatase [Bacillota bacterium]